MSFSYGKGGVSSLPFPPWPFLQFTSSGGEKRGLMYTLKGRPEESDCPLVSHKINPLYHFLKEPCPSPTSPTCFPQFVADLYECSLQTQPGLLCWTSQAWKTLLGSGWHLSESESQKWEITDDESHRYFHSPLCIKTFLHSLSYCGGQNNPLR